MDQKGSVWIVILSIVATLGIAAAAYFFGQTQGLKSKQVAATVTPIQIATIAPAPVVTPTPTPGQVTATFDTDANFTAAERAELQKKIADPYIDYYKEPGASTQSLLTLNFSRNSIATSKDQYPYSAKATFNGGAASSFLIAKLGTGVDWWYPECQATCNLSAAFKAKYPEIASKVLGASTSPQASPQTSPR